MPWTDPDLNDWAVGQAVTASDMDTYVKDNLSWLGVDRPHCQVRDAAATAAASSAWTAPSWAAPTTNVGSMASAGNNFVTATTAGFYLVGGSATFAADDTGGVRTIQLASGTPGGVGVTTYAQSSAPQHGGNPSAASIATCLYLTGSAQVYLWFASSDTTTGAVTNIRMWAIWMTS